MAEFQHDGARAAMRFALDGQSCRAVAGSDLRTELLMTVARLVVHLVVDRGWLDLFKHAVFLRWFSGYHGQRHATSAWRAPG